MKKVFFAFVFIFISSLVFSEEVIELSIEKAINIAVKNNYNYPRIYLLSKFWSHFYITAKYGLEKLKIGSDKLFKKEEADLALKHARECYNASRTFYDKKRWQDG